MTPQVASWSGSGPDVSRWDKIGQSTYVDVSWPIGPHRKYFESQRDLGKMYKPNYTNRTDCVGQQEMRKLWINNY